MPRVEEDILPQRAAHQVRTTRKRRERIDRRAVSDAEEEPEHFVAKRDVEESSAWLDGPLALTLLPPLGSFLTGGSFLAMNSAPAQMLTGLHNQGDFVRDVLVLALLF